MRKNIEKLHLGILYNKSNSWWNIPYLKQRVSHFKNLELTTFDFSNYTNENSNINKIDIPSNLSALTLLPYETGFLPLFLPENHKIKWVHSMFSGVDKFLINKEISEK